MRTRLAVPAIGLSIASFIAIQALSTESHKMAPSVHEQHVATMGTIDEKILPVESGQSAFAAIGEIVTLLKNDPTTDWSKVDIDSLREHLVDMNELTLHTSVDSAVEGKKVVFRVSGEGRSRRAIQAMMPAHASVLSAANLFDVDVEKIENGAIMRIVFDTEKQRQEIQALGFYGIMAIGAHHQEHHLQMAKGNGHIH